MRRPSHPDPHHHTAPVALEDGRDALQLSSAENADLCAGCVRCCSYITIEVDAPRAAWEYDQWIWALDHHGVGLYLERPEKWFVHFETTCRHLNRHGRCGIHGRHPVLCREYDPRSCERRLPLADIVAWFHDGAELEAWIREKRPAHHRRLLAYRSAMPPVPPVANGESERRGGLVSIAEPRGSDPSRWMLARGRGARDASRRRA
jgi:hypothetical protein